MNIEGTTLKKGEGYGLWLLKIVTGALVIVLLFVHLVVNHLVATEGLLSFQEVVDYLSTPGIALMEGTFLVVVVVHALIGARSIILDLNPNTGVLRAVDVTFSLIGIVSIVYGIWLLQVIISFG